MRSIVLFAIVFCLALSCNKKNAVVEQLPEQPQEEKDSIEYRDIEPDIVLNTVSGYSSHPGGFQIALPIDTACSDSLRFSEFPPFGFSVGGRNFFEQLSVTPHPQSYYNTQMYLAPTAKTDSFMRKNLADVALFSESSVVDPKHPCSVIVPFIGSTGGAYSQITRGFPNGEYYFGFKTSRGGIINIGWIKAEFKGENAIRIKEIAINKTHNKPIRAGQKQ